MLGRVFKAYDVRGTYPDLLTDEMAWQIGFGVSKFLLNDAAAAGDATPMMKNVVVGRDMRKSSPALSERLMNGITVQGGDVIDVGLVDTPFVYFAINHLDCSGGVQVTASHNPPQYNGFKVSKRKAKPVGEETGLNEVRKHAAVVDRNTDRTPVGRVEERDLWDAYSDHVLSFLDLAPGKSLKIVIDASNGMAGVMVPKIFGKNGGNIEGLELVELNFDVESGEFAHEPNPLVESNLEQLQAAVVEHKADCGVCFDGDADRLVVVDEKGKTIGCDKLTALLAPRFLADKPGTAVIYDLRSTKAVAEEIEKAGGIPVRSRVGHVFMKQALAERGGCFGGELSGHFYFADNFNADSGAIALATLVTFLGEQTKPLSKLIAPIARYAHSGEINFEIEEKDAALEALRDELGPGSDVDADLDELDGVTLDCFDTEGWWANIRKSNTEPLLRLNCEARDAATLERAIALISPHLGTRVAH
ncbi:MAG: phosphomannomutase/phosphoglucomutase [Planctomycetota bacterium]